MKILMLFVKIHVALFAVALIAVLIERTTGYSPDIVGAVVLVAGTVALFHIWNAD